MRWKQIETWDSKCSAVKNLKSVTHWDSNPASFSSLSIRVLQTTTVMKSGEGGETFAVDPG